MSEIKMWDDMDNWELIAEIKSTREELINGWCKEVDQLKEERDLLAYENKNMAEFIKYNDKTLTDTDVGDIATSTVKSGVWDRFRTNAKFDRDGTLLSELPASALWSDDVWDRFKINNNKGDKK